MTISSILLPRLILSTDRSKRQMVRRGLMAPNAAYSYIYKWQCNVPSHYSLPHYPSITTQRKSMYSFCSFDVSRETYNALNKKEKENKWWRNQRRGVGSAICSPMHCWNQREFYVWHFMAIHGHLQNIRVGITWEPLFTQEWRELLKLCIIVLHGCYGHPCWVVLVHTYRFCFQYEIITYPSP